MDFSVLALMDSMFHKTNQMAILFYTIYYISPIHNKHIEINCFQVWIKNKLNTPKVATPFPS